MRYLLDTHALIWWLTDSESLNTRAREAIADPDNEIYISTASLWEIGIKYSTGKMDCHPADIHDGAINSGIFIMDIQPPQVIPVANLAYPGNHRDPFDHLIVAIAQTEEMILITNDRGIIANYDLQILRCENKSR